VSDFNLNFLTKHAGESSVNLEKKGEEIINLQSMISFQCHKKLYVIILVHGCLCEADSVKFRSGKNGLNNTVSDNYMYVPHIEEHFVLLMRGKYCQNQQYLSVTSIH